MSNASRIIPLVLVTVIGIGNAIYVFDPALKEQAQQKQKKQHQPKLLESDKNIADAPPETITKDAKPAILEAVNKKDSHTTPPAEGVSSWGLLIRSWTWSHSKKPEVEATPIKEQPRELSESPSSK